MQNHIRNIMGCTSFTAEERLNLISNEQIRFDKLNKETKVLNGAMPVLVTPAPAEPPVPALPNVEKDINPASRLRKKKVSQKIIISSTNSRNLEIAFRLISEP